MCCIQSVVQILDVKLDTEARLVVAIKHHRCLCIHNGRSSQTTTDCLVNQLRIGASLLSEGQSLCNCCNVDCNYHLVSQLCNITGTKIANVYNRASHYHQHVIVLVEQILLTTYHNRQGSVDCLRLTTGYRSIQHLDAVLCALLTDLLALSRINGAHVNQNQTRLSTLSNAILAQDCCSYVRGIRNHGDNYIYLGSYFLTALCCLCTAGYQICYCIFIKIENDQLVTCFYQVLCHRSSHDTKSNKSNFHFNFLTFLIYDKFGCYFLFCLSRNLFP